MNRQLVIRKIMNGDYDMNSNSFIRSYESIFNWMISRDRSITLSVNIYSLDFLLIWNINKLTLEPFLDDNTFIVHMNKDVLPRYGTSLTHWLKNLHNYANEVSSHFVKGIDAIIMSYLV